LSAAKPIAATKIVGGFRFAQPTLQANVDGRDTGVTPVFDGLCPAMTRAARLPASMLAPRPAAHLPTYDYFLKTTLRSFSLYA